MKTKLILLGLAAAMTGCVNFPEPQRNFQWPTDADTVKLMDDVCRPDPRLSPELQNLGHSFCELGFLSGFHAARFRERPRTFAKD